MLGFIQRFYHTLKAAAHALLGTQAETTNTKSVCALIQEKFDAVKGTLAQVPMPPSQAVSPLRMTPAGT